MDSRYSPEPHLNTPPQNTSTPAQRRCSDSSGSGNESIRGLESTDHSEEEDLDEFFKNAEGLSDQTFGDRIYDCSLLSSTDVEKSLSHGNHHTLSEGSASNFQHFHDLSCSMLADAEKNLQKWKEKSREILGAASDSGRRVVQDNGNAVELLHNELIKIHQENEHLKRINKNLSSEVEEQKEFIKQSSAATMNFIPKVRSARESIEIANLSMCSLDQRNDGDPNTTSSFRLSSYVRQLDGDKAIAENQENISCQTSPIPYEYDTNVNNNEFIALSQNMNLFRRDWTALQQTTKQKMSEWNQQMKHIALIVQQTINCYDNELYTSKRQRENDQKHYQEVINTLKDEIKTIKMRHQMKKHKEQEIREQNSRLIETDGKAENELQSNLAGNTQDNPATFDESFSSCNSNVEETFTNLTRTKVEYLKLTPSEYIDDDVFDAVASIPDGLRHILEDKDLKYRDLEKKYEANKRYLEDLTHDRELEREEFQQSSIEFQIQIEDLRKENAKFLEDKKQLIYQIEDLTNRLKNAEENGMEFVQKLDKSDRELKAAVEKIYELREIVREQEGRIDEMTQNVAQLEEQKQVLRDELEKQEILNKKEQPIYKEQDSTGALPWDVTDEIHQQLQDLAKRIQGKVVEMDGIQLQTRPSSSCSGVTSAVSTEDISCRDVAGRISHNFHNTTLEHMGSAILNEIHRLESHFDNLVRYDDVFIKKLKDADLQSICQKNKMEEMESQIAIFQEKCSSQMLTIADLEGKIDALRFESSNHSLISSLQSRLSIASKQLDELRILLASKESELAQVRADLSTIKAKQQEKQVMRKEASSQTFSHFEEVVNSHELSFEGVSPEKIRRMDTVNPLNASVISLPRNVLKDSHAMITEPEISILEDSKEKGRAGRATSFGGGDSYATESSAGEGTIKEMDENLHQLHQLLQEKDKEIQKLNEKLRKAARSKDLVQRQTLDRGDITKSFNKCEEESVVLETDLNPGQGGLKITSSAGKKHGESVASDGDSSMYEIRYSHDYEVDGDLLKYLGTKLLYQGPRTENIIDQGERRVLETDKQIEIATLNTHILQLKRALEDEKRKCEDLLTRLKLCEEEKAKMRSRSPMTKVPVQNVVSSASVYQMQQKELVWQVDEARKLLREKEKEIRSLKGQVSELESKLKGKDSQEQELMTRLNKTIVMLRRCEDHGRELSASNQEQAHEIRRLRLQFDRANTHRINENFPQSGSGNEHLENFMRAKSYRKALAWQKKYLYSVILGYKSILRQTGHGSEHPDLLQAYIPIAPGAVGYLDMQSPRTRFRVGVLTVIATLRMKYMVSRWSKKRPGESSPDSEYKASRNSNRIDSSLIRPKRTVVLHSKVNAGSSSPLVNDNVNLHESRQENFGDISEYLSRFASLENEISSSLSRNVRPSKP